MFLFLPLSSPLTVSPQSQDFETIAVAKNRVITSEYSGPVWRTDLPNLEKHSKLESDDTGGVVAASSDGKFLALAGLNHITVMLLPSLKVLATYKNLDSSRINALAVNNTGSEISVSFDDHKSFFWNTRKPGRKQIPQNGRSIESLCFSADGTNLLCGGMGWLGELDLATNHFKFLDIPPKPKFGYISTIKYLKGCGIVATDFYGQVLSFNNRSHRFNSLVPREGGYCIGVDLLEKSKILASLYQRDRKNGREADNEIIFTPVGKQSARFEEVINDGYPVAMAPSEDKNSEYVLLESGKILNFKIPKTLRPYYR